jgi:small-conductance mechanosensitive channel
MKDFFDHTLFQFGDHTIKISSLLYFISFFIVVYLLLRLIKKIIYRGLNIDTAKKYSIYNLARYIVIVLAFVFGLEILGVNLNLLIASSAALLVGVGLGLQNLFSDFVSGIILLVDSSVKVNDVIEVNGLVCRVEEINLRTTTVLTRDDNYIILPNTDLTRNRLVNWTHEHIASRFEVSVGVDYQSDIDLVMRLMVEAAQDQKGILKQPKSFSRFDDFGDSSLNFSVFFWTEEIFGAENIKSAIRTRIFELFKEHNVTIPFPQRVVHFDHNK